MKRSKYRVRKELVCVKTSMILTSLRFLEYQITPLSTQLTIPLMSSSRLTPLSLPAHY